MNKIIKILLIIFVIAILGGIIAFIAVGNTANAKEYKLGNDTIKSIKTIVEKRQVVSTSTKVENGITIKEIEYKSDSVQDDLLKYTQYLRDEGGFYLTKDMDLSQIPSKIELGKQSSAKGKLVMMIIEYNSYGYKIIIQKGEGTLNKY